MEETIPRSSGGPNREMGTLQRETPAILAVVGLYAVTFLVIATYPASALRSPEAFDTYVRGWNPEGRWVFDYPPFKYRIVFPAVMRLAEQLLDKPTPVQSFHSAFVVVSFLSFVASGLTLYALLRVLHFNRRSSVFGAALWLSLPAIPSAFMMPTQTREDLVGYVLMHLGLIGMLRRNALLVALCAVVGVLTRETLAIIPLLFCIHGGVRWSVRLAILSLSVGTYSVVRWMMGIEAYDRVGHGLIFSLAHPTPALLGMVMLFGWGWLALAFFSLRHCPARLSLETFRSALGPVDSAPDRVRLFESWALPACCAIVGSHLLLGRIEEIRVSMLAAPWVIYAALTLWDEARRSQPCLRRVIRSAIPLGCVLVLLVSLEATGVGRLTRIHVNPYLSYFANSAWWAITYIQITGAAVVIGLRHAGVVGATGLKKQKRQQ